MIERRRLTSFDEPEPDLLGDDINYESLGAAARELGRPLSTLYALSPANDPFMAGLPARQAAAEWFAEIWDRLEIRPGAHLRRIHYRVISQDLPVPLPNGEPYINTSQCWNLLCSSSRDARYLGLVSASDLVDRR